MATSPQQAISVSPARPRAALRALRRAHQPLIALLVPEQMSHLDEIPLLNKLLAFAEERAKDVTIIGGLASLRAEAIERGLRVATDVAAWSAWCDAQAIDEARRERRLRRSGGKGWQVLRPEYDDEDVPPPYITTLHEIAGLGEPMIGAFAEERYEDAVVARLWAALSDQDDLPA